MQTATTLIGAIVLCGTAQAQIYSEDFTGSDQGAYELIFAPWNQTPATGGNPANYRRLMNTAGTGDIVDIRATAWPNAFSGNWRSAGVGSLGFDMNIVAGAFNAGPAIFEIEIVNDNGTPNNDADDCVVGFQSNTHIPPNGPQGWVKYDWNIPSSVTNIPGNFYAFGPAGSPDAIWNIVMTDVSHFRIHMDMNPAPGAPFSIFWDLGVDNIRVEQGAVGTNYCQSGPNSTGMASIISASGSSSISQNDLVLSAGPMDNEPGIFFFGTTQLNAPFGNGTRCVGGSVFRLPPSFATGNTLTRAVNVNGTPANVITAGSLWNFQAWFRDPAAGGAGFDLSDGLAVGFVL